MNGVLQSGGTDGNILPLSQRRVILMEASGGVAVAIEQTTTAADGSFAFHSTKITSGTFYAVAEISDGVELMTVTGPSMPEQITINELTTVAAIFSAAQFIDDGKIQGDSFGLRIVAKMNANLVDIATGASSRVLLASPNADETNTLRSTRSLANLLAACVRNMPGALDTLLSLTTTPGGTRPSNTLGAIYNIARYPANQVGALYTQSQVTDVYQPPLSSQPDAWTLAVKVNDTGDNAHMFGGPANLVFDSSGRAWIANNVIQGTNTSTRYGMVLNSDGTPGADDQGNRISPYTGGGLLGAGFGIGIDSQERIWVGCFGWGGLNPAPDGSVAVFDTNAQPLSPPGGHKHEIDRVQGTVVDDDDNVWLASYGNHRVVVYPGGDATSAIVYDPNDDNFLPFGIAIAADGTGWITNSYSDASSVIQLQLDVTAKTLTLLQTIVVGQTNKGIAIDSAGNGNVWIGSGGDNFVYVYQQNGQCIGAFQCGGLDGPWGVFLDGNDDLWAANFGPLHPTEYTGRLTKLAGPNAAKIGLQLGDPITPSSGYTLKSEGEQVRLPNGDPLYGIGGKPCYVPLMRTTGGGVDAAGNLWICNNWKPSFINDLIGDPLNSNEANPGGDGIVIFIGLTTPLR